MFNLGDKVRDKVTGFKGVVISRTEYLNGCIRYGIQGEVLKDGVPAQDVWIDEQQLDLVQRNFIQIEPVRTGGPRPAPKRAPDPKR